MGRQARSLRAGEGQLRVSALAAKSSVKAVICNYGVTELTTDQTAGDWVLAPPSEGVRKIIYTVNTTTGLVIRGSTGTSVTFTEAGATQVKFDGAGDKCVSLLGRSDTKWIVTAVVPATTAIVIGTS